MILYELLNKMDYDQIVRIMDKGEQVVCDDAWKVAHFNRKLPLSEVRRIYTEIRKTSMAGVEKVILIVEVV